MPITETEETRPDRWAALEQEELFLWELQHRYDETEQESEANNEQTR